MTRSILCMCLGLMGATAAQAGPWIREPGSGWAKIGVTHFRSTNGFVSGANTGLPYRSTALEAYAEVGLPGKFQVVASMPWVAATHVAEGDVRYHHRWTGDLRVQLDRALLTERPLALGLETRIATYRRPYGYVEADGVSDKEFLALQAQFPELGDPNVDFTLKLLWGTSSARAWWAAEGGPRIRLQGYAHGLYAATNGGVWLIPQVAAVTAQIDGNVNVLPSQPQRLSREVLSVQGGLLLGPGPGVELGAGFLPTARHTGTGVRLHASAFMEW